MTKKKIREELPYSSWIDQLEDLSVEGAINWLQQFDRQAVLEVEYFGYDGGKSGVLACHRLETDQEEVERENKEAVEARRVKERRDAENLTKAILEQKLIQSKIDTDVAVWAYLQLHKDNPDKGDLENLMRAYINLEAAGHSKDSLAMQGIMECMKEIENV